jgi:hypothetical protein
MTRKEYLTSVIAVISALLLTVCVNLIPGRLPVAHAFSGYFYGANQYDMMIAAGSYKDDTGQNRDTEQFGNWCGISNMSVIEAYISDENGSVMSQQDIYNIVLQGGAAESPWGYANPVTVNGRDCSGRTRIETAGGVGSHGGR